MALVLIFCLRGAYKIIYNYTREFDTEIVPSWHHNVISYIIMPNDRIAFVTFKEAESAQLALDAPEEKLTLDGR